MYTHIDLCCGLGGWQAPFREADDWRSIGIDVRPGVSPDILGDVRQLPVSACEPDLVTASPPCTEFSTAHPTPMADRDPDWSIWQGCWEAIDRLNPTWHIVENVRGMVYWQGSADKIAGRDWFLWGHFPPFDCGDLPGKPLHGGEQSDRRAKIPYLLAEAVRQAVETWS